MDGMELNDRGVELCSFVSVVLILSRPSSSGVVSVLAGNEKVTPWIRTVSSVRRLVSLLDARR
jgi:hypothetical protein